MGIIGAPVSQIDLSATLDIKQGGEHHHIFKNHAFGGPGAIPSATPCPPQKMIEEPALGFALPCLPNATMTVSEQGAPVNQQLVLKQLSLKSEEELGMLLEAYSGQFGGGCGANVVANSNQAN